MTLCVFGSEPSESVSDPGWLRQNSKQQGRDDRWPLWELPFAFAIQTDFEQGRLKASKVWSQPPGAHIRQVHPAGA